jgi:hypothetical protein
MMNGEASETGASVRAAAAPLVTSSIKTCICTLSIAAVVTLMVGCEKFALDRQMEELCKIDGGVRIYETVTLPPDMFDERGDPFPGWRGRKLEDRVGSEFRYTSEVKYLKPGDPGKGEGRLDRILTTIYRKADGKLMGEAVSYGRSGGDFIAYAHSTSNSCPKQQSESDLIRGVFLQRGK